MKLLNELNINMKLLNKNINIGYKWTRIEFWYISAGICKELDAFFVNFAYNLLTFCKM